MKSAHVLARPACCNQPSIIEEQQTQTLPYLSKAQHESGAETQTVPLSELKVGDVVLVRPGGRVPADGIVAEGAADVDESMITGESRTVSKGPGGSVIAGTVAGGGSLRIRITAVGDQTALSGI